MSTFWKAFLWTLGFVVALVLLIVGGTIVGVVFFSFHWRLALFVVTAGAALFALGLKSTYIHSQIPHA